MKITDSWELSGRKFPITEIPEGILKEERVQRCNAELFRNTPRSEEELEFWAFLMKLTFFDEVRFSEKDILQDETIVAGITEMISKTTQLLLAFTEECIKINSKERQDKEEIIRNNNNLHKNLLHQVWRNYIKSICRFSTFYVEVKLGDADYWVCIEGILGYLKAWDHKSENFENKLAITNTILRALSFIKDKLPQSIGDEFGNKLVETGAVPTLVELLTEFLVTNEDITNEFLRIIKTCILCIPGNENTKILEYLTPFIKSVPFMKNNRWWNSDKVEIVKEIYHKIFSVVSQLYSLREKAEKDLIEFQNRRIQMKGDEEGKVEPSSNVENTEQSSSETQEEILETEKKLQVIYEENSKAYAEIMNLIYNSCPWSLLTVIMENEEENKVSILPFIKDRISLFSESSYYF